LYYVKSAFFNRSKEFQEKAKIKTPKFSNKYQMIMREMMKKNSKKKKKNQKQLQLKNGNTKQKKQKKIKYIDVLHKILQYFKSNSFSRDTI
jgi:hypothetical protein